MSSPVIWIFFPLIITIPLFIIRGKVNLVYGIAAGVSFLLALLAFLIPAGVVTQLGPIKIELLTELAFFGRKFVLGQSDQYLLILIYATGGFLFLGGRVANAPRTFPVFGLAVFSLLVAAMAVEPFLYAALLVEMAVLISVPLLAPPGTQVGQGVLRFLIFQTLGMPFILFSGWLLGSGGINLADQQQVTQILFLLGLGFAFWLAVFPFYSWIPLLASETHPYLAGFILNILPPVVLLLALDFLGNLTFIRELPVFVNAIRLTGVIMVVTGGVWAAFQVDLNRVMGYAVIFETGFLLLAFGLSGQNGLAIFGASLFPRMFSIALIALSLSMIRNHGITMTLAGVEGIFRKFPFLSAGLLIALLSIVGLPALAEFPVRISLLQELSFAPTGTIFPVIFGMVALLFATSRIAASMLRSD
ncbi:MAG: hypothetical protein HGA53_07115, partial [Anaerolineaceae bacterium]|nr:hypothetical protein [Anaerolineaceae bacterium]